MRALGIDLGHQAHRRGRSATSEGTLATPYEVVEPARATAPATTARIAALAEEAGAEVARRRPPAVARRLRRAGRRAARAEAAELAAATGLPVELWDERLTTVTADRDLQAMDLDAKARRRVVDKVAAAVMLQAWLDHRRLSPAPEDPDR